ncbi:MAG: [FeFe] hydrogenase H-cluster radical SAM maturase HydE [Oscillospiraceae bacterium]
MFNGFTNNPPTVFELSELLNRDSFEDIYAYADDVRKKNVGDEIKIRAILEFSNYCKKRCRYCGLNVLNKNVKRFRMTPNEIIEAVKEAHRVGYKTIVLQSGEDSFFTKEILGDIVRQIKKTGIAITVSCGELADGDYAYLKECGADRYLLKHETADSDIYSSLHPFSTLEQRVHCLKTLKSLGYETGSGFMIGLPNQTTETIAKDLLLLNEIGCDMAGIGPFISHPDTELHDLPSGSTELTLRAVALARILLPKCHIPATTSLGVVDRSQRNKVFCCGANIIMQKITPNCYKRLYEIYPSTLADLDIQAGRDAVEKLIYEMGKIPD